LGFEGAESSAEGTRMEAPQAPRVYGGAPPQKLFSFMDLKMRILVRSPARLECLFLHYNTSRSRHALRLPTLTFQADCGWTVAVISLGGGMAPWPPLDPPLVK